VSTSRSIRARFELPVTSEQDAFPGPAVIWTSAVHESPKPRFGRIKLDRVPCWRPSTPPAHVVHGAPSTLRCDLPTTRNRALHQGSIAHRYRREAPWGL
jgi:hypothetical protein